MGSALVLAHSLHEGHHFFGGVRFGGWGLGFRVWGLGFGGFGGFGVVILGAPEGGAWFRNPAMQGSPPTGALLFICLRTPPPLQKKKNKSAIVRAVLKLVV